MIFLDTNVISETLRKNPDEKVMAWLAMHDDSLALPTITKTNRGRLATRNTRDFSALPIDLINPWA